MKSLILMMACTLALLSGELQYEHDFHKALQKADRQHKEVLMIYSAPWCPECNYMKDVVFKDPKVHEYIRKHYVILPLDIQKDTLPKGFSYIGIPTFIFVDKNGKEQGKIIGGSKAPIFLQKLRAIK